MSDYTDYPLRDYMLDRAGVDRLAKYLNGGMAGVTGLGSAMSFGSMPYMGPWNAIPGTIFGAQSLGYMADAARAAQNEQMHRQGAEMWSDTGMPGRPEKPLSHRGYMAPESYRDQIARALDAAQGSYQKMQDSIPLWTAPNIPPPFLAPDEPYPPNAQGSYPPGGAY